MDFITDLPPSVKSGVKTLLIITDRLNKGIILILILLISALRGGHSLYKALYPVPRVPKNDY